MALRRFSRGWHGGTVSQAVARLNARHPWSHNDHFHSWVLARLPEPCGRVLDVGCGRGELLVELAAVAEEVVGLDAAPAMVAAARARCAGLDHVRVGGGDWTAEPPGFDAITMVAVLHHLAAPAALAAVRDLLAPGGRFLAVGLADPVSVRDHAWDVASILTNPVIGWVKHPWPSRRGVVPAPYPVADPVLSFDELAALAERELPGAVLRHRLGFRHTLEWTKPA